MQLESIGAKFATAIFTGRNHAFYQAYEKIYGWGLNNYGQLGDGCTKNTYIPHEIPGLSNYDIVDIQGGENHTIAVTSTGQLLG